MTDVKIKQHSYGGTFDLGVFKGRIHYFDRYNYYTSFYLWGLFNNNPNATAPTKTTTWSLEMEVYYDNNKLTYDLIQDLILKKHRKDFEIIHYSKKHYITIRKEINIPLSDIEGYCQSVIITIFKDILNKIAFL